MPGAAGRAGPGLRAWAADLAHQLLAPVKAVMPWVSLPIKDASTVQNPWSLERRKSADGDRGSVFISSLPAGETLMGVLRSRSFKVPPQIKFFMAGHDGEPDHPPLKRNFVRLVDASNGEVLMIAPAPRHDDAQAVVWDLAKYAGRKAFLEIIDGLSEDGYAWIAAGRFEPAVVPLPEFIPNSISQRQQTAAELARTVPLPELQPQMLKLFSARDNSPPVRAAAAHALVANDPARFLPMVATSATDTNQTPAFRENIAELLSAVNSPEAREAALAVLATAPRRSQINLAQILAATAAGAEAILSWVEQKKLSPQILMVRQVKERLSNSAPPEVTQRFETLTKNLPSANLELMRLMEQRRNGYDPTRISVARGGEVFTKNCAICHQIDGKGAVLGPQLDGVGNRGLERLIEDVLDPNRNVDPAFHYSILTLKDDTTVTGLQRREEGETLVFADSTGKEVRVAKKDIAERRESDLSLMPSNFSEVLRVDEFHDLMAFLLSHGPK